MHCHQRPLSSKLRPLDIRDTTGSCKLDPRFYCCFLCIQSGNILARSIRFFVCGNSFGSPICCFGLICLAPVLHVSLRWALYAEVCFSASLLALIGTLARYCFCWVLNATARFRAFPPLHSGEDCGWLAGRWSQASKSATSSALLLSSHLPLESCFLLQHSVFATQAALLQDGSNRPRRSRIW